MSDSRAQLLTRKRELFDALRVLERDCADGVIDYEAYRRTRERYELEAAALLERLDVLHTREDTRLTPPARLTPWLAGALTAVIAASIGIFLTASLHTRSANQTITGAQPPAIATPARAPSAALIRALRAVAAHPHDINALLTLAKTYSDEGRLTAADRAYRTAMRFAPDQPQPPTLDALVLAASGRTAAALDLLRAVERGHPGYARAWLSDGLIAARQPRTYGRAIAALRRFLRLMPRAPVAAEIRQAVAGLQRAHRTTR